MAIIKCALNKEGKKRENKIIIIARFKWAFLGFNYRFTTLFLWEHPLYFSLKISSRVFSHQKTEQKKPKLIQACLSRGGQFALGLGGCDRIVCPSPPLHLQTPNLGFASTSEELRLLLQKSILAPWGFAHLSFFSVFFLASLSPMSGVGKKQKRKKKHLL